MVVPNSSASSSWSPSWSILNLLCPGVVQILIGKTTVGILFNAVASIAYIVCLYAGITWTGFTKFNPLGWGCIFTVVAMSVLSGVDALLSIKHLRAGKPLHAWQMFPVP